MGSKRIAAISVTVLLVVQLAPFDFVRTTAQLHECMRRSLLAPTSAPFTFRAVALAGGYLMLGFTLARFHAFPSTAPPRLLAASISEAVTLAAMLEVLELFIRSCRFGLAELFLHAALAGLGCLAGLAFCDGFRPSHHAASAPVQAAAPREAPWSEVHG